MIRGAGQAIRREPALQPPAELTPQMREALRRLEEADRGRRQGTP